MADSSTLAGIFAWPFMAAMVWAIVSDARRFELPNALSLALLGGFALLAALEPFAWSRIGWHLATGLLAFLAGFGLFVARLFGGGDVKLLSAIAVWLGPERFFVFLLLMSLTGGLLALALLLFRRLPLPTRLSRWPWLRQLHARAGEVPYGVAIGIAGLALQAGCRWPT